MARTWNDVLRWIHLVFGLMLGAYFFRINQNIMGGTWSEGVTMFVSNIVIFVLLWTGISKWQLPRIIKFYRNRIKRQ